MQVYTGIDPGLVHTGAVRVHMDPHRRRWEVEYQVFDGLGPKALAEIHDWVVRYPDTPVFIEDYRSRKGYNTDPEMIAGIRHLDGLLPTAKLVNNTGSKDTIRRTLLRSLRLDKFPATHHQDLQAAARILVWGMLKAPESNRVLYDFVRDNHVDDQLWTYVSRVVIKEEE